MHCFAHRHVSKLTSSTAGAITSKLVAYMEFPRHEFDYAAEAKRLQSPQYCEHPQTELRCKPDKNDRPRYHHQCTTCGRTCGPRVPVSEVVEPGSVREWDHNLEQRAYKDFHERMERHRNSQVLAARKHWEHHYGLYLRSQEWQDRRRLVLLRAQGICEGCRIAPAIDVHHRTYDNVGHEFLFELLALCRPCHDRYHAQVFSPFLQRLFFSGVGQFPPFNEAEIDF